ncbi:MAG: DEAD/DEAH box helicase family protein [Bacteroidales bacterium]|nr:DEAD/DEAH box helicase family protein [Bacteroidales bacterium]
MTPEEKARVKIDKMFEDAGWQVVSRDEYTPNLTAAAIKEGLLKHNLEADYFLFINGKAVGVLEAKRAEIDVDCDEVKGQAEKYVNNVPPIYAAYEKPLRIIYLSNGEKVLFYDYAKKDGNYIEINRIHTPKEIVDILSIDDFYAGLPTLQKKGLRQCQFDAIKGLEESFRNGQKRALMVLATGAGKTYAACLAAYRFLSYTPMRKALFLVDRNNLGKQAEGEFGTFRLTENKEPFNTIFGVNRLKSAKIPSDSNVVISTIQRLFSLLKGDDVDDNDEESAFDDNEDNVVSLPTNPLLPPDYFDLIIIDECHRSIYGNWRQVLDYFKTAKIIGLTATPIPETVAFFNNNIVVNYTLEDSIKDGVNVDHRTFRIRTEVTENGGAILQGDKTRQTTVYTGKTENVVWQENKNYTREELNRSIINPAQIKLILETYRDSVYTEMFVDPQREPNFDYLPKTLIFALNENHANNIVKIAKDVFNRHDDKFVQKITYSVGDSNALIRQFRNDKDFRIAVTCTLVATGTDVKPLEVLIFMRDVASEPLFVQMKGRGVRTIGDEQLRNVTPNAISKDCFYLVDAVGVTERQKSVPKPGNGPKPVPPTLKELLELLAHGNLEDDNLRMLASRLSRIHNKCTDSQREEFANLAHITMSQLATDIFNALEDTSFAPFVDINAPNVERKTLIALLINNVPARNYLLIVNAGFINTLMPGEDNLIYSGFSREEAIATTSAFEEYCNEHKDEIEALRIIYNNDGAPISFKMLKDLQTRMKAFNNKFTIANLWHSYSVVDIKNVAVYNGADQKNEKEALTNLIQLVRFAWHKIARLESLCTGAQQRFNLWYGQMQRDITAEQIKLMRQIVDYIAANGTCQISDIKDYDKTFAAQLISEYKGLDKANEALESLSRFIIYRKAA